VPSDQCIKYSSFHKFNPKTQLTISGSCASGCDGALSYAYQLYFMPQIQTIDEYWVPFVMPHMPSDSLLCKSFFLIEIKRINKIIYA
jgi:hypothetical protein